MHRHLVETNWYVFIQEAVIGNTIELSTATDTPEANLATKMIVRIQEIKDMK